jgi:hypothetical protein
MKQSKLAVALRYNKSQSENVLQGRFPESWQNLNRKIDLKE